MNEYCTNYPILPTVYSDALSYEEQICKILRTINNIYGDIESIKNANEFLIFNNINDMVLSKNLNTGMVIFTLGYNEPNDGGEGVFLVSDRLSDSAEDGGITFFCDTTLLATRIVSNYVTPEMFGAKGDGVNDDYEKIQNCLNSPFTTFLNSKTYVTSKTLKVTGSIYGVDKKHSVIKCSSDCDILTCGGNLTIKNIGVVGAWDGLSVNSTGNGITVQNSENTPYNIVFSNIKLNNIGGNGIIFQYSGYSSISDIDCRVCGKNGIEITGSDDNLSTTLNVSNCTFNDMPNGYSIVLTNCADISLNSVITEYSKGILIKGNTNRNINLYSCYAENISSNNFITVDGDGYNLNIIGCYATGLDIVTNAFHYVNVIGCTANKITGTNINFSQLGDVTNINNVKSIAQTSYSPWNIPFKLENENNKLYLWCDINGNILTNLSSPNNGEDGNILVTLTQSTPASTSSFGILGQICLDNEYFYIKTKDGWKRVLLSSF